MKHLILLFALLLVATTIDAQAPAETLSFTDCWERIRSNHPLARQATLLLEQGRQELRYARGGFDPKVYGELDEKTFDGKNYFRHLNGGIKVPTLWGPVLNAEYDWTNVDALFLNPENSLPSGGQAVLGLELPLVQGLFFDENRSRLRQAEEGQLLYSAQARALRNELFLEANKAYWDWAWAYYARELTQQALDYSEERLQGIRQAFIQGDYPAIDTLEAFLQYQSWQLEQQEASIRISHAGARLQAMLWEDNGQPLPWNSVWQPEYPGLQAPLPARDSLMAALNNHPSLQVYQHQLRQQEYQRRWYAEQLKPDIRLSFNLLGDQFNFNPGNENSLVDAVTDNYKLGIRFTYPLFLRKERAGLAIADIKLNNTDLKLRLKQQELETKFQAYWQEWTLRQQQAALASDLTENYGTLLAAEQTKFQLGESSVFLLNSRQQKWLEAQLKQLKTQAELQKAAAAVRWVAGYN